MTSCVGITEKGLISTPIADREVDDRFLEMSAAERYIYDLVETYIRETYNKSSAAARTAVGFVMTIYRKRLASSFYATRGAFLQLSARTC